MSKSTELFCRLNTGGLSQDVKPLVILKKKKVKLELAGKANVKKTVKCWNNTLWTDKSKTNLYQMDGTRRVWRREGTDLKHTTSSGAAINSEVFRVI